MGSELFKVGGITTTIEPIRGGGVWLYYAQLPHNFGFKIGITEYPMGRHDPRDKLEILYMKNYKNALELEQDIIRCHAHLVIECKILLSGGDTEVFEKDIRNEKIRITAKHP